MGKNVLFVLALLAVFSASVLVISATEIEQAKGLIASKATCTSLSDDQLEIIGEYLMEQMHPGAAHELMHGMMGFKEGTDQEKLFHIQLAKSIYCDERGNMMSWPAFYGMMGGGGMWGSGSYYNGNGMMGFNRHYGWDMWPILVLVLLIGLIILVYLKLWKAWREVNGNRKRN